MDAPWTAVHDTLRSSPRQNVPRRGVVLHHAATTNLTWLRDVTLGRVSGRTVSYTAITRDHVLELIVSRNGQRPWSLANAFWDSAMRSVCLVNSNTAGWAVSDQSVWSAAAAVAFWSVLDGFWPHRDGPSAGWTVIGHGEVRTIHGAGYATACPGGTPVELVTARAQWLRSGLPGPEEEEDEEMVRSTAVAYSPAANTWNYAVLNTGSGFYHEFGNGVGQGPMPASYLDQVQAAFDTASGFDAITAAHAAVIRDACAAVRAGSAPSGVAARFMPPLPPDGAALGPGGDADYNHDNADLDGDGVQ